MMVDPFPVGKYKHLPLRRARVRPRLPLDDRGGWETKHRRRVPSNMHVAVQSETPEAG